MLFRQRDAEKGIQMNQIESELMVMLDYKYLGNTVLDWGTSLLIAIFALVVL
jgi:hypothetical protein